MAVLETECSFAKSRSSSSASSSNSDYLYSHIYFPTSYDVVFGKVQIYTEEHIGKSASDMVVHCVGQQVPKLRCRLQIQKTELGL
ncbi:hypothetical protein Pyn_19841 [Prunus yedoensis var. nudiflora]|uniref:Uncharacterized protein n=1 Tax=Prunus yedoensis var. nudiflora TaxID=2094558 RepID=A0A314ZTX4_PRUYE|nr:hypothetical protein Pyn_19841 [Prunus yedoensis var. nudiflora]